MWDKTKITQLLRYHLRNFLTSIIVFYSIKDKTCPLHEVPRVQRNVPEELPDPAETKDVVTEPRQKQPRVCGNCGLRGHNRRSCQCNN